jgi:hypothetical protein
MDSLFSAPESSCYLYINIKSSPCPLSSVVEVLKVLYFMLHLLLLFHHERMFLNRRELKNLHFLRVIKESNCFVFASIFTIVIL